LPFVKRKIDFLIIGGGIAGCAMHFELTTRGKKCVIIDQLKTNSASRVAAGLCNPVTGQQYALTWKASEIFLKTLPFYQKMDKHLKIKCFQPQKIFRIMATNGEQNIVLSRLNNPEYQNFAKFWKGSNKYPIGILEIYHGGWLNTVPFLEAYQQYLCKNEEWINGEFQYNNLDLICKDYLGTSFDHAIFCEGINVKKNPFFPKIPLNLNKGQLIEIEAPRLELKNILIGKVFIVPLGNNRYCVGSTYQNQFKDDYITESGLLDLKRRLESTISVDYSVVQHFAGIRPMSPDRKPILGTSKNYPFLHIMNGMGSKAVSMMPYLASEFSDYLIHNKPLLSEINWQRF
jgi:glycine oxidase